MCDAYISFLSHEIRSPLNAGLEILKAELEVPEPLRSWGFQPRLQNCQQERIVWKNSKIQKKKKKTLFNLLKFYLFKTCHVGVDYRISEIFRSIIVVC